MKQSVDVDDQLWPVFAPHQPSKIKSFWDKQKKGIVPQNEWMVNDSFFRTGKLKKKPKSYHFMLDDSHVLYYFKSEKDKIPKGKLQLTEEIQIRLEHLQVGKNEEAIAITFQKTDKIKYQIFTVDSDQVFKWYEHLRNICSINNFDSMYIATELLGKGSFAHVYKVKRLLDDELYAGKFYYVECFQTSSQKEKFVRMIKNEVMALRSLQFSGILRLHEIYQQPDKIILITNLVQGVDLYQLIRANKKLTESHSVVIINNLARSLHQITTQGFAHRDIKLENIIVTSKTTLETVLLDFGFAERINKDKLMSKAGTPGYIAPEVFESQPYTEKGDVFSLGVIFYSLVSGRSPFKGNNYKEIMEANRSAKISFDKSMWAEISEDCKSLIQSMMHAKPEIRITFKQIIETNYVKSKMDEFRTKYQNYSNPSSQQIQSEKIYDSFDFRSRGDQQIKSFFKQSSSSKIKQSSSNLANDQEESNDIPSEDVRVQSTNTISNKKLRPK